jgi:hypothetical protein
MTAARVAAASKMLMRIWTTASTTAAAWLLRLSLTSATHAASWLRRPAVCIITYGQPRTQAASNAALWTGAGSDLSVQ